MHGFVEKSMREKPFLQTLLPRVTQVSHQLDCPCAKYFTSRKRSINMIDQHQLKQGSPFRFRMRIESGNPKYMVPMPDLTSFQKTAPYRPRPRQ